VQNGRLHIEKINLPFLRDGGSPAEYGAGLKRAIGSAGSGCMRAAPT
jgi:hypothetical protein